jgi:hypothetical protein
LLVIWYNISLPKRTTGILLVGVPKFPDLGGHQLPKLFLLAIEGLFADTHLAGDLGHLRPLLGLLQGTSNLLVGKSGTLYRENPPCQIFLSWQNSLLMNGPVGK